MTTRKDFSLSIFISAAESIEGQWVAHCLDFDIMSQGDSPRHAMEMICEAIDECVSDDLGEGLDPFRVRNSAPAEDWALFREIRAIGKPTPLLREQGNRKLRYTHMITISFPVPAQQAPLDVAQAA